MKDIIPAKKQSPILGLTGMGGGVGSNLGGGLVEKSPYIDELFSSYTYRGNATARTINTGIDIAKNGGLVWLKNRDTNNYNHNLFDTVRGATKLLNSNATTLNTTNANTLTSFNNNGFSIGNDVQVNNNNEDQIAWTFSKRKGLFDVVSYTGDGVSGRTVPHGLGCMPGSIIIKSLDDAYSWFTYHGAVDPYGDAPWTKYLMMNHPNAVADASWFMYDTAPTATEFTVGHSGNVNADGSQYIAYIFAGAESSAATARSVDFDGSGDYLSIPASSDLNLDGDFTIEAWVYVHDHGWSGTRRTLLANNIGWTTNHAAISLMNSAGASEENTMILYNNSSTIATSAPVRVEPSDGWTHIAITRDSANNIRFWKNGVQAGGTTNYSGEFKFGTGTTWIGAITMSTGATPEVFDGKISNLRVIKGTALYTTAAFTPPTGPLTNVTNTKLLCCNNSSTTGATVTPATITANGDPTASIDSPFDDPDCFKFGENEDQQVIKCGSYIGNGSSDGPDVYLGWEPQWLMVKSSLQATEQWHIIDNLRGMNARGINEIHMEASTMNGDLSATLFNPHPRGFKVATADSKMNNNNGVYIYYAIRRPDGYVGKPAEAGTDVFAMDNGASSNIIPNFDSGFPVDFAMDKNDNSTSNWDQCARLIQGMYIQSTSSNPEGAMASLGAFDSNAGWQRASYDSNWYSWMWKRHAGFEVVTYTGDSSAGRPVYHNLNKVPEMIWVKNRGYSQNWKVYHMGLNEGTTPQYYSLELDSSNAEVDDHQFWNDTAPNSTYVTLGTSTECNYDGANIIMMLFASVPGISKCGYYTGNGTVGHEITGLGFQPRFIIIKRTNGTAPWVVLDTKRGWGSGDDRMIYINQTASATVYEYGAPIADGFRLDWTGTYGNSNGDKFIYYAHA